MTQSTESAFLSLVLNKINNLKENNNVQKKNSKKPQKELKRYEVHAGRHDEPSHKVSSFNLPNDKKAKERFIRLFVNKEKWQWDNLILYRISKKNAKIQIAVRVNKIEPAPGTKVFGP